MIDAPPKTDVPFATGPFGAPQLVAISTPSTREDDITLTGDMLEIFFESDRVAIGQSDIYTARRASITDAWSLPSHIDELSTAYLESSKEENLPFYNRFGFQVTEELTLGAGAPPMWAMWRDPR